jgi:hypothetical protein
VLGSVGPFLQMEVDRRVREMEQHLAPPCRRHRRGQAKARAKPDRGHWIDLFFINITSLPSHIHLRADGLIFVLAMDIMR